MPKKKENKAPAAQATIALTSDMLCSWTGLTDRRHRQIAAEGYFPAPVDGVYQLSKTIVGMFRYYREQAEKAKGRITDLRQENLEKQNRRLDIEIKKIEGEMIEMSEVDGAFMRIGLLLKAILFGALEQELPAKASGKTPEEIRLIARDIGDRMCECYAAERDQWHHRQR
jgi:hypothetical protein